MDILFPTFIPNSFPISTRLKLDYVIVGIQNCDTDSNLINCPALLYHHMNNSHPPFLLLWRISLASFSVTPAGATTRSSRFVITCQKNVTRFLRKCLWDILRCKNLGWKKIVVHLFAAVTCLPVCQHDYPKRYYDNRRGGREWASLL